MCENWYISAAALHDATLSQVQDYVDTTRYTSTLCFGGLRGVVWRNVWYIEEGKNGRRVARETSSTRVRRRAQWRQARPNLKKTHTCKSLQPNQMPLLRGKNMHDFSGTLRLWIVSPLGSWAPRDVRTFAPARSRPA